MADTSIRTILSVCATTGKRLPDLPIKDGQLVFVQDKHRIAFDFGGKRVFYNRIIELSAEAERLSMDGVNGCYYFVIETAVLWTYQDRWIQITTQPEEIVFIGTELPELGVPKKLYVNKEEKSISVWDEAVQKYIEVANAQDMIDESDIDLLF